jgi:hypothetical protein
MSLVEKVNCENSTINVTYAILCQEGVISWLGKKAIQAITDEDAVGSIPMLATRKLKCWLMSMKQ